MSNEEKNVEEILDQQTLGADAEQEATETEQVQSQGAGDEHSAELRLAAAEAELARYKDQYVRAEAEMANFRRRVEKDVENAHKFGQEKLSKELLAVADNLERTILAAQGDVTDVTPIKEGVEMTLKGLLDAFAKFSIEALNPEGAPFDPQYHQAMSMVENPNVEPNTVIAVMQKGYTLHGRLIRPAMVMVSKATATGQKIDEKA